MDIRYHALCEWVERDLITLQRIDTSLNQADHCTKNLSRQLFYRHVDYIMGHVPPAYSHVHKRSLGIFDNVKPHLVPQSYTTPKMAAAAKIFAPVFESMDTYWMRILVDAA